jgi:hypothetical protein
VIDGNPGVEQGERLGAAVTATVDQYRGEVVPLNTASALSSGSLRKSERHRSTGWSAPRTSDNQYKSCSLVLRKMH